MPEASSDTIDVLVVVSGDFGELSSALDFVRDQAFGATLALPPRLYELHARHIERSTVPYRCYTDLISILERASPRMVLLFSGYLLVVNRLFSEPELATFVTYVRARGYRLATTDPFLALLSSAQTPIFNPANPASAWLARHFAAVCQLMKGCFHLYPAPVATASSHPGLSFFNPPPPAIHQRREQVLVQSSGSIRLLRDRPRWMFVLSAEDHHRLATRHGVDQFNSWLIDLLCNSARLGRQPVLVAPSTCIEIVRISSLPAETLLVPFCNCRLFDALVTESEYVFFWNVISHSVYTRAVSDSPFFFLDRGHMADVAPALFARAIEVFYNGVELPMLSPEIAPDSTRLAELAASQRLTIARNVSAFARSPSPASVVQRILQ